MNTLPCPLCEANACNEIETIKTADVSYLFKKLFNIKTEAEFQGISEFALLECSHCHLQFFSPALAGSAKFYEALQSYPWYYLENKEEFQIAKNFIGPHQRVLEIGCGQGAFASEIKGTDYVGLEFSTKAAQIGIARGVKILTEPVESFSKNNAGTFDVVCTFQVLEHIAALRSFIEHSRNCLRPGGTLILSVPNADSFISLASNALLNMPPHHLTWWNAESLAKIAELYNLDLIAIKTGVLETVHRRWFLSILLSRRFIKPSVKLIDTSFKRRFFDRLSWHIAGFLCRGLDAKMLPIGHSITAVYKKR